MHFFLIFFHLVIMNFRLVVMQIKYNTLGTPAIKLSTKFVAKVKVKMCYLEPDIGPCRGDINMYYFNSEHNDCLQFDWGGCQGNGNRFHTKEECYATCLTKPNEPQTRPRYCDLTFDYGFCFGAIQRWYYDRLWKVCKERIYSGCGGNKNNFYSFEQCDHICRLGKLPLPTKKRARDGKAHTVLYVYTNGTTRSRVTTTTKYTKSRPRYMYTQTTTASPGNNTNTAHVPHKVKYVESKKGRHYRKDMGEQGEQEV